MKLRYVWSGVAATIVGGMLATQIAMAAPEIGNSAFRRVWTRQDFPVSQQVSSRSWTWGPAPNSEVLREKFIDNSEGARVVQYFDKSRMEINDPTADPNSEWYVTNGLLPIELMTGRMQVGFNQFEHRAPADVVVIGDLDNSFPTYRDLLPFYQSPGAVNRGDIGKPATGLLQSNGTIGAFNDFDKDAGTVLVDGGNNHGVPKVFVDFMNQRGIVSDGSRYFTDNVYNPLFVFGQPVSGAFWVKVKVGGKEMPILFQVFERRVLTYNPANDPAFRVEMGNVGQHYYKWRYESGDAPAAEPSPMPDPDNGYPAP